ncbi:MAG: glycosyltransferase [Chitinophagaceae bacterium]|nr:glycosyltransferase [Chitinophagaceae bacterium]MCW5927394.1 glycosyltransferase [Chitinophagaceae bacterium]
MSTEKSRKKIIWLVSWYPSRLSPFSGDFIKRHAEAASLYNDIHVIYVMKDEKGVVTKTVLTERFSNPGLTETIVYYHIRDYYLSPLNRFLSHKKYISLFKKEISGQLGESAIDLSHVHVGLKAGFLAEWTQKKYRVPYVLSDHWTGFLEEADENYRNLPFFLRRPYKRIVQNAMSLSMVSHYLVQAYQKLFSTKTICRIPNVVDNRVFNPGSSGKVGYKRFIHVSTLDDFKNFEWILQAFNRARREVSDIELIVVTTADKTELTRFTKNYDQDGISFYTAIPQKELSVLMRQSDALILYSSYETFGCVVIEANACGIPVIASDIPVMREIIVHGENGFLVPPNNPEALSEALVRFTVEKPRLNSSGIAEKAARLYNYEIVGKMFSDWYDRVLASSFK